jgi:hypothetical protein
MGKVVDGMIHAPRRDRFPELSCVRQACFYRNGEYVVDVHLRGTTQPEIQEKHTVFWGERQPPEAYRGTL